MNRYTSHVYAKYEDLDQDQIIDDKKLVKQDKVNYPRLHIAPAVGLLNDPNGLIYYNGLYHIFYQVCPNGPFHGMKSWNLVTTKDFVNYEDHGIILKSSEEFENFGIFSGGAIVLNDCLCLLYTANFRDPNLQYKRKSYQVIATLDDEYNVLSKRVIREPDEFLHTEHFRDPMAIDDKTILIGAQDLKKQGQIGIINYSKSNFEGKSELTYLENQWNLKGFMFECPNIFSLENKNILIFSPQGVESKDRYCYKNIHDVVYSISDQFDPANPVWDNQEVIQLDYGFDFYAPQVFNDGTRTLMIGWLGVPDTIYPGDNTYMWSQMLTTVRELKYVNDQLLQLPIEEYSQLETEWIKIEDSCQLDSKIFRLKFTTNTDFEMTIGNADYSIKLQRVGKELILNRGEMEHLINQQYGNKRYLQVNEQALVFDIIVDMSSIEIFINNGQYVMTSRFFIDQLDNLKFTGLDNVELTYMKPIQYRER